MDKEMLEKAQLRIYLKCQIRRIRDILALRKLQTYCRLRILAKRITSKFNIASRLESLGLDDKIDYLISLIVYQVNCLVHDHDMWQELAYSVCVK